MLLCIRVDWVRKAILREEEEAPKRSGMKVIIMGCGRVGEQVAPHRRRSGGDVIDYNAEALDASGPISRGARCKGVGFDRQVLIEAGIEEADALAATSSSDNANIVAARVARKVFQVPRVVARLFDPRRAEIYQRLGLVTISSTTWGARRIYELLTHSDLDCVMSFGAGEVKMIQVEVSAALAGPHGQTHHRAGRGQRRRSHPQGSGVSAHAGYGVSAGRHWCTWRSWRLPWIAC